MRLKALSLSLMTGLSFASVAAFAEPAIEPGETIESLSKVKITTTVNGQPGSINELVASGQVKLISDSATPTAASSNSISPAENTVENNTIAAQPEVAQPLEQPSQAVVDPSTQSQQVIEPNTQTQAPDQALQSQAQELAPADASSSNLEAPVNGVTMTDPSATEQLDVQPEALPEAK